jgi:hypothetical protein
MRDGEILWNCLGEVSTFLSSTAAMHTFLIILICAAYCEIQRVFDNKSGSTVCLISKDM